MKWGSFTKHLFSISIGLIIWALGVSSFGKNSNTLWIYIVAILSFIIFSWLIFLYAYNTSSSDHLFSYNNVVVASFLLKLVLSIGVLMLFERIFQPHNKMHILHFIIVYLIYTIYEVYFLTKLAKSSE